MADPPLRAGPPTRAAVVHRYYRHQRLLSWLSASMIILLHLGILCGDKTVSDKALLHLYNPVGFHGDRHAVLYVVQKFVAERIDNGHDNTVDPNVRKYRTRRRK